MDKKRLLSENEIEKILDFIKPQKGIHSEVAMSVVEMHKNKLRKQLDGLFIFPEIIPKLKKKMEEMYEKSKIQAGESVGIIAAQSFGQFQTQSTLNSFHKAGLSEKTVVSGVSRFSEILDATKIPKSASCIVFFKDHTNTLQDLKKLINHTVVGLTLRDVSDNISFHLSKKDEEWYKIFEIIYNKNFRDYESCISITFNQKMIFQYNLSLELIAKRIEETYGDLFCVFSPLHKLRMDIFVDLSGIQFTEQMTCYVTPENVNEVYLEDVVIPKLENFLVCGISGISNMFFASEKDEWFIETEGSNFSDILAHPKVDSHRTITNNIWEIYDTLGIEAVRQYMIEELTSSMTGINQCHSRLLADKMTHNGTIVSISRYGMRASGSGALSKASFEETLENLLNAAGYGESDDTESVSAGIICGNLGKFGTGICELMVDVPKLSGLPRIIEESVEEC